MKTSLTFYGDGNEIGRNKVLLGIKITEDGSSAAKFLI